ncbi:hypothetical protein ACQ4LE_002072 [Meloidogyne hapla]|uniref:Uncharacterized protein n=1 Tax=Meloidogyne hapla TaxID=6305 RepID=A0A1I8BY94_MELHA
MTQFLQNFSSKHQLFAAVAEWLQLPIIPLDDVPSTSKEDLPVSIPLIFSHEFWFDYFALPLINEIGLEFDSQAREWRLQKILISVNEIIGRVSDGYCSRDRMMEFEEAFKNLIKCSERPISEEVRRLAQRAFARLLNLFEAIAQMLLLFHLFELVLSKNEISLSEEVYEPQVLALLIDTYRQKCFSKGIDDDKYLFQSQLECFYKKFEAVVYEDPFIAVNFYTSILLLINAQAINHVQINLLSSDALKFIQKIRIQVHDWMDLQHKRKLKGNNSKGFDDLKNGNMVEILEEKQREKCEKHNKASLEMLCFQLDEAEKKIMEIILKK